MKKITDFIVKQRNIILVIFVALAGLSIFSMQQVNINHDMTKYLPESSEVKAGLEVMTEEFGEADESSLTVMLADLSDEERISNRDYLAGIEQVKEVAYDDSDKYNRDNYTRYILTIDAPADSEIATKVYDEVEEHYKEADLTLGGEVAEQNHEVLPIWIVAMAVGCALVILIVMSESYVEPFLFLTTILIAVLLNKGTNIIFPSVSNITDSITAILQLALSMDYSIMLMNRYQQEKPNVPNKVEAMKRALFNAFKSISSSSITTIVGMLALVFMSFTIGQDMGLVLAKGVLFSLIAIFTCLPGLILLFDRVIEKTKKKSPSVSLKKVGNVAYQARYLGLGLFVLAFGVSYVLQGGLGILYTDSEGDKIAEVFGNENQMAVLYDNNDEEKIAEHCRGIDGDRVEQVLCYGNTIGLKLTAEKLPVKMEELGVETKIDDYLLKIIYYHYYRNGETGRVSLQEFVRFVEEEIYAHEKFGEKVDAGMRANLTKLKNFASIQAVTQPRSGTELAGILEVSPETVDDLLVYYNSGRVNESLTAQELVWFLDNYVVGTKYGAGLDAAKLAKLQQLATYTNKDWIQTKRNAEQMAATLNIDSEMSVALYNYYGYLQLLAQMPKPPVQDDMNAAGKLGDGDAGQSEDVDVMQGGVAGQVALPEVQLSPLEFVNFILAHRDDEALAGQIANEITAQLVFLQQLMNDSLRDRRYATIEAAQLLGLDEADVRLVYSLYEMKYLGKFVNLSTKDFVSFLLNDVMQNPKYAGNFDDVMRTKLYAVDQLMNQTLAGVTYSPAELVNSLASLAGGLDQNLIELLYIYHGSIYDYDAGWQMTIEEFVKHIADKILTDARFDEFIGAEMRDEVKAAETKVADAKALLVGEHFSRIVLNTSFEPEATETFDFIRQLHEDMEAKSDKFYVIGDSVMAYEMSQTFNGELNMITVITMIFIFVVVALTFGSLLIPIILVLLIQCAVYMTMGIMSMSGAPVYFIAILIVQSILMGATIDYAILYTSYYIESRQKLKVKAAVGEAYTKSIHAIATSSSILILVTLIVGNCTTGITSKILLTISEGTTCATLLILLLLPAVLAACDKIIMRHKKHID